MDPHHVNPDNHYVHVSPLSTYLKVFGALLVLTVATVGVSVYAEHVNLDATISIIIAMAVAVVKASLVGAWFMHLKYDTKFNVLLFLSSFWFIALFFIFTCIDLGSRDSIMDISGNRILRADLMESGSIPNHDMAGEHAEDGDAHGDEGSEGAHGDEEHAEDGDGTADAGEEADPEFDAAQAYNLTCGTCHGEAGDGNGPAGGALNPKPRDFTDAAWWDDEKTTDEYVAKVIKEGGPAVGLSPLMAPWGGQYDDEQIAAMVDHLKTFKK